MLDFMLGLELTHCLMSRIVTVGLSFWSEMLLLGEGAMENKNIYGICVRSTTARLDTTTSLKLLVYFAGIFGGPKFFEVR